VNKIIFIVAREEKEMDFITKLFGTSTAGINPVEAQAKLTQKAKPYLLDVRQPEEYRSGHINGAKLIPLGDLSRHMNELPKDREIICVCRSGNRSLAATRQLSAAGYNVTNLNGGMMAWARARLPIKKGN
jgi:rhodanese-related sulfurtransferase